MTKIEGGEPAVWALESLWPANVKKSLLTLRFIAITLNKGMNAHAFLKLNLVSVHNINPPKQNPLRVVMKG
jgi:hypothetical protein